MVRGLRLELDRGRNVDQIAVTVGETNKTSSVVDCRINCEVDISFVRKKRYEEDYHFCSYCLPLAYSQFPSIRHVMIV